jgi:hypothetical protein
MADAFIIGRDRLAAFIKDADTLRRFEKLFRVVAVEDPEKFVIIFRLLEELAVDVVTNSSSTGAVRDSLAVLVQGLDQLLNAPAPDTTSIDLIGRAAESLAVHQGTVDAKAGQAIDLVASLLRAIEVAVSRPGFELPRSFPVDYLDFDQAPPFSAQTARVGWNSADDTLNIHHSDGVTQQVGQETYGRITNNTGSTIPNGVALGINPATNSYVLYIANGTLSTLNIVGVTTQQILSGQQGRITVWGRVRDIDTTGTPYGEVWVAGDILYVSTTIAGGFTKVKPTAPNLSIPIAQVITVNATTGQIAVRPVIEQQLFYGQFAKTTDQVPTAANTADAITWPAALISNGVSIGAPTSRIVVANAGLYKFAASFQLTSGSASVKNVWFWFRKNGVDIANTALITSMDSGTAVRSPSRSLLISLAAGDYVEVMWAADDTNVTLDAIPATAFSPAAPAALLTVNQEQQ